ncbi:copper resistance CopC family protein [Microtetraspora malaysiensis]|uniref:Copper resistance protein CopC n=1 Tax=Microtetraspora malaysiensis TaxID=161358 RepID=A0ABW6SLH2_9ACTN
MPRFIRSTVVAVLGCGLFLTLTAPAAFAHDSLKHSSPAKDAQVSGVKEIELEYSAQVRYPVAALRDAAGQAMELGTPRLDGSRVVIDVTQPLTPGGYVIAWRVVSSDGHPIEGEIPFTVTASEATASGSPDPTGTPLVSPSVSPSAASEPLVQVSATGAASADVEKPAEGVSGWLWAGLVALAVIGGFVLLRGGRRSRSDDRE